MPLGYDTVIVRHLISGEKLELYVADAVQYLEHPWFSQYYIIDGPIPLSGIIPITFGASGNVTKVVNNGLSGTIPITFGTSGTVSKRSQVSGTVPIAFGASGNVDFPAPITGMYVSTAYNETDLTTYTFANQGIGSNPASGRRIVVSIHARHGAGRTPSTVTIGGVSASQDGGTDPDPANASCSVWIYSAIVPTGTTGDIVVTWNDVCVRCMIMVWELSGGSAVDTDIAANTDPTSVTLSTAVDDFVIVAGTNQGTAVSYTGATERVDAATSASTRYHGADTVAVGASTVVDIDLTGTLDDIAIIGAAYR